MSPAVARADFDGDGDVDQTDFAFLQICFTGLAHGYRQPVCGMADFDSDNDVDAYDLTAFLKCISGSDQPANIGCIP